MLPPAQMRELYDLHPADPWEMVCFEDGRHLDAYESAAPLYWPALQQFLVSLGAAQPLPPLVEEGLERLGSLRPPQQQELRKDL